MVRWSATTKPLIEYYLKILLSKPHWCRGKGAFLVTHFILCRKSKHKLVGFFYLCSERKQKIFQVTFSLTPSCSVFSRSAWQFLPFLSALTQLPLNYIPAMGCCSTAEEEAISSLLNVHFDIKIMTENACHSQPRKHTTTLANKYRLWWKHYLHMGKTKACKQRKRRSTWIMFLHQRPNHLRLYHGTSALNVALVKGEVGLSPFVQQACRVHLRENCQLTLLLEELWTGVTPAVSHVSQKQFRTWSSRYPNLVPKTGSSTATNIQLFPFLAGGCTSSSPFQSAKMPVW